MTRNAEPSRADRAGPSKDQPHHAFTSSASASLTLNAPLERLSPAPTAPPPLGDRAVGLENRLASCQPGYTCKLTLNIGFFFDGTGNNLNADEGTDEHSNVARLFKAYPGNRQTQGFYRFYIPGLGTYFRDIGDIGDDDGMAFGSKGDARLNQAMTWLKDTIARHPADKTVEIKLSVFGFSRGAALARAFVRRVQDQCATAGSKFTWLPNGKPCSVHFLGLFDTVASVGLPASTSSLSLSIAKEWKSLDKGLTSRRRGDLGSGLKDIAFGNAPGADPTPAVYDGHMSWAKNLRVPSIVEHAVHLMAMNEVRNSFPLDTMWDGNKLPSGATEHAYPGVHSNVGGGYRPGEGGKSASGMLLLSKIPLRKMYDEACAFGVPFLPTTDPTVQTDFEYMPELAERFNKVLATSGMPQRVALGDALLANMQLYYRWRFRKIRLGLRAADKAGVAQQESQVRAEAEGPEGLKQRVTRLENDPERVKAQRDMNQKKSAWMSSASAGGYDEGPHQDYLAAKERFDEVNDEYLRERAKLRTLPVYGGELVANLDIYDKQLLLDVAELKRLQPNASSPLRPHYQKLLEAYDDEFDRNKGLTDPLVIDFFDSFVHDSLAGFAKDATLPSDPRCAYIGGDAELKFADLSPISNPGGHLA